MRTTVTLADDVAAAVEQLRQEQGVGVSEAVNQLVRTALGVPKERKPVVQRTYDMGTERIDVSNVWEAIEQSEGPDYR